MSDKKLGVLKELRDVTDCHSSPAHIVIESHFVASKNAVVEKTRFTADVREINECLPDSSYPLPFVATDSKVVSSWCSLKLVPRDLARKILSLQKFQYRFLFVESRINPADCLSRLDPGPAPEGEYPRFLRQRIFNSKGVSIPWQQLSSRRKSDEAKEFFLRRRNQPLSRAVDKLPGEEVIEEEEEESNILFAADHSLELPVDEKTLSADPTAPPLEPENIAEVYASIAAVDFNNEELEEIQEEAVGGGEEELEEEMFDDYVLPTFSGDRLEEVKQLQQGDFNEIRKYLKGEKKIPSKYEALDLSFNIKHFLCHKSLFRISDQNLLFRLWVFSNGKITPLIVVEGARFQLLIENVHKYATNGNNGGNVLSHVGQQKTLQALERKFYTFQMRRQVNAYISKCSDCRLNTTPVTSAEKDGSMMRMEPNEAVTLDYWGPIGRYAQTSGGKPRYCLIAIDQFSCFT